MDREFLRESLRLRRIKGFRKRGCGRGRQIVHHEAHLLPMGSMLINQFLDKVRPIHLRALLCHFGIPLTCSRFKSHKNVCRPIPLLLCVIPQRLSRLSGKRRTHFPHELGRHCVHAPLGILRVLRGFLDISDFCQGADQSRILLWWHAPFFLLPGLKFIFFQVRRMVSCDTDAITSNSTMLSASLRQVHRSRPSGA
jgi:hypothetical protein